jgi:hypothetical protein
MLAASPMTAEAIDRFADADRVALPDREQLTRSATRCAPTSARRCSPRSSARHHRTRSTSTTCSPTPISASTSSTCSSDRRTGRPGLRRRPILEGDPWAAAHAELHPLPHRPRPARRRRPVPHRPGRRHRLQVAKRTDFATNVAFGTHSSGTLGARVPPLRELDTAPSTPAGTDPTRDRHGGRTHRRSGARRGSSPPPSSSTASSSAWSPCGSGSNRSTTCSSVVPGGRGRPDAAAGFGETGELYLAGSDNRLRTDPRGYRERSGLVRGRRRPTPAPSARASRRRRCPRIHRARPAHRRRRGRWRPPTVRPSCSPHRPPRPRLAHGGHTARGRRPRLGARRPAHPRRGRAAADRLPPHAPRARRGARRGGHVRRRRVGEPDSCGPSASSASACAPVSDGAGGEGLADEPVVVAWRVRRVRPPRRRLRSDGRRAHSTGAREIARGTRRVARRAAVAPPRGGGAPDRRRRHLGARPRRRRPRVGGGVPRRSR